MSSSSSFFSTPDWFPPFWGHSGWVLEALHHDGAIPYWACFVLLNVLVRTCLWPVVIYGAHTSARFATVMPEIQFVISMYLNDLRQMRARKASSAERWELTRINLKSVSRLYKAYGVNPFSIFLSPLLQLPIFIYISTDLRKMVNGLNPSLAQELVDAKCFWITDLTEPDPWFGLPVLCGVLLYANVEVAVGRRTLAGPAASQSNTALLVKDLFQCLAVFMPCFTSAMPTGIQLYVATTFTYTALQSELLRTAQFRSLVGLPPLAGAVSAASGSSAAPNKDAYGIPPDAPKFAAAFIRLQQLEQEAIRQRGSGPLLGEGVLNPRYQGSFAGTARPSTIQGSGVGAATTSVIRAPSTAVTIATNNNNTTATSATTTSTTTITGSRGDAGDKAGEPTADGPQDASSSPLSSTSSSMPSSRGLTQRETMAMEHLPFGKLPFVHGVSAPLWQQQEQAHLFWTPPPGGSKQQDEDEQKRQEQEEQEQQEIEQTRQEEMMARANRGERPVPLQFIRSTTTSSSNSNSNSPTVNLKRFQKKTKQSQPSSKRNKKKKKRS